MTLIGSHVSMHGKDMFLGSAKEAASYHATTFSIYTGAPQNTRRKPIAELNIVAGKAYMQEHGLQSMVIHAPYIINLANTKKLDHFSFAVDFLQKEVVRAEAIGAKQIVLHPGSHVGAGSAAGIANIVKGLNEVLRSDQTTQIALETMAGKGTEVGRTFEELAEIITGVTLNDKLSVCFDTCHTSDAGYAIKTDFDGVMTKFDHVIGLDRLKVIHLNDSKNPQGSHKDRHADIGLGYIGFERLNQIVHDERFNTVPKIMETPWVKGEGKDKFAPYGYEIAMFERQQFNPNLEADILAQRPF
ncbi:deoxyribonuclease IV [Loigolactobacillus backii]|uniref:Probable endonuclease 4 n=1 Tax=Loigolactobacillus backii TaxID=375175 RepID=A0A192H4D0_9LACO|nr:deoxyribonuclease IV [Loigolactobacillus backii]ANK59604.1 deoxyribonuclease IV [Loigolactobacillus backii]ANK62831.1 deoxyribonuclease IV [Loigolactobacillus backii]ANK64598.1 deoxyribonuclease IV [Loigolactobacillus backii]ANK67006.1 deoxyribonuclease IV [Loigolactobacillus backii]ANK70161.1 deoxyribonuclease IV [Loigolactobacillus backii]